MAITSFIIGSVYWRSWWNYPPVSESLINTLKPDFLYLTHVHWDHFQGPSLRRFKMDTPVITAKGNPRVTDDLIDVGFKNIIELDWGDSFELSKNFKITLYPFWMYLDSAAIIEKCWIQDNNYNGSVVVNTGTGSCCTIS